MKPSMADVPERDSSFVVNAESFNAESEVELVSSFDRERQIIMYSMLHLGGSFNDDPEAARLFRDHLVKSAAQEPVNQPRRKKTAALDVQQIWENVRPQIKIEAKK